MVDDFMVVCVDRIIASTACVEGTCEDVREEEEEGCSSTKAHVVECRICQEEDQVQALEAPCSCNGTLKYAHRKCIQRWCNKKGDTTCEICNQAFSPDYYFLPARENDVMAIDIGQGWTQNTDLHDSNLLTMTEAERHLLQQEFDDYAVAHSNSFACLQCFVLILVTILLLRQALMAITNSVVEHESYAIFNFQMLLLQVVGVLLPCYGMARSWYIIQNRRRRQG